MRYLILSVILLVSIMFPSGAAANTAAQIDCLAENLWHEGRGEGEEGMVAIAFVVMNRVVDKRWPDTVCKVVKFKVSKPTRTTCAFSWLCQGMKMELKNRRDRELFVDIHKFATNIITKWDEARWHDPTGGAQFYHSRHMTEFPKWAEKYEYVTTVNNHIFYHAEQL